MKIKKKKQRRVSLDEGNSRRELFCFSLPWPHHRPFDIHIRVGEVSGGNGDFHEKIPGVEVNVVRIQIDIPFPLSLMYCRMESNEAADEDIFRPRRWNAERARSKNRLLLVVPNCETQSAQLSLLGILIVSLKQSLRVHEKLERRHLNPHTFIDRFELRDTKCEYENVGERER